MKILLHITEDNTYIVGDERTARIYKYKSKDLTTGQPFHIKYLFISKKNLVVETKHEKLLRSNAVSILCSLVEGTRVIGYMTYIPAQSKLVALSGDGVASLVSQYGIVEGKVKVAPVSSKCYLEGSFSQQPSCYHKQIYMELYRERREKCLNQNKKVEKIVRSDVNTIEIRYLPPFSFDRYLEPKGVNVFNFKWWKIVDGNLQLLKRPSVKHLDLSNYCESIKYVGVPDLYSQLLEDKNISVGSFANWGIESVKLGGKLKEIGKEAFYSNNLTDVKIKKNVVSIGERAFMNNLIERLFFCKGGLLNLGSYAFANNNLQEVVIPNNIISIGEGCFSGNIGLYSVSFESDCKIRSLESNVFSDCAIETITLPDSIENVSSAAFDGCDNLKEIIISSNSRISDLENFISVMKSHDIEVVVK